MAEKSDKWLAAGGVALAIGAFGLVAGCLDDPDTRAPKPTPAIVAIRECKLIRSDAGTFAKCNELKSDGSDEDVAYPLEER